MHSSLVVFDRNLPPHPWLGFYQSNTFARRTARGYPRLMDGNDGDLILGLAP